MVLIFSSRKFVEVLIALSGVNGFYGATSIGLSDYVFGILGFFSFYYFVGGCKEWIEDGVGGGSCVDSTVSRGRGCQLMETKRRKTNMEA